MNITFEFCSFKKTLLHKTIFHIFIGNLNKNRTIMNFSIFICDPYWIWVVKYKIVVSMINCRTCYTHPKSITNGKNITNIRDLFKLNNKKNIYEKFLFTPIVIVLLCGIEIKRSIFSHSFSYRTR
jgi:hypothetical protein